MMKLSEDDLCLHLDEYRKQKASAEMTAAVMEIAIRAMEYELKAVRAVNARKGLSKS